MSRFRPGRRKGDDHSPGEDYDGNAYEGDPYDREPCDPEPYDREPYDREPDRGAYPPRPGSYPVDGYPAAEGYPAGDGGRGPARAGAPRPSGRSHTPRFRKDKDEVLQPTSVISPRGLVGGPRPDPGPQDPYAPRPDGVPGAYGPAGAVSCGAGPVSCGAGPDDPGLYDAGSYGPQYGADAGYAYPAPYDVPLTYGPPAAHGPGGTHVPAHAPGYETGAAYPPGPDSEVDPDGELPAGHGNSPPYAPPDYGPAYAPRPGYGAGPGYAPGYGPGQPPGQPYGYGPGAGPVPPQDAAPTGAGPYGPPQDGSYPGPPPGCYPPAGAAPGCYPPAGAALGGPPSGYRAPAGYPSPRGQGVPSGYRGPSGQQGAPPGYGRAPGRAAAPGYEAQRGYEAQPGYRPPSGDTPRYDGDAVGYGSPEPDGPAYVEPGDAGPAVYRDPSAPEPPSCYVEPQERTGYSTPGESSADTPADLPVSSSGGDPEDPAVYFSDPAEPASSAYEEATEPEPYLAPHDPNTGAQTEPFRGPFEPHPAQPKLSDLASAAPLPAEMSYGGADPVVVDPFGDLAGPGPDQELAPDGSREKLEKIKELYRTVEAIGDDNVGKHFDELMQLQRELISDYFKETGIGNGKSPAAQPEPRGQN